MSELVTRPRFSIDLEEGSDRALQLDIAVAVMFEGMLDADSSFGDFTGVALDDFFNERTDDPVNARKIINGLDRAELIAGYHRQFLTALKAG
jgi:putative chitinase